MVGLLNNSDQQTREMASKDLGLWGTKDSVPALIKMAEDASPQERNTRRNAIISLGQLKDERAIVPLILATGVPEVTNEAEKALVSIGAPAEKDLVKYSENENKMISAAAVRALKAMGSKENGELNRQLSLLKSPEAQQRRDAANWFMRTPP